MCPADRRFRAHFEEWGRAQHRWAQELVAARREDGR